MTEVVAESKASETNRACSSAESGFFLVLGLALALVSSSGSSASLSLMGSSSLLPGVARKVAERWCWKNHVLSSIQSNPVQSNPIQSNVTCLRIK